MRIDELYKINQPKVQTGPELDTLTIRNIETNVQPVNKFHKQNSFFDKINEGFKLIPWKDVIIWSAIVGGIYILIKATPKNNSRKDLKSK